MAKRRLIERTGRALYGERWQSALARDIGYSDRMVRLWAVGQGEPPSAVYRKMIKLVIAREAELRPLWSHLTDAVDDTKGG